MEECLFCKIISGDISSQIVYQDEYSVAFLDINPQARVHILIVPRVHIATIADIEENHKELIGHLVIVAKDLAHRYACHGYKLLFNVGKEVGQIIFHIHLHLMGR